MSDERELLRRTAEIAADFLDSLGDRPVFPETPLEELGAALGGPLPGIVRADDGVPDGARDRTRRGPPRRAGTARLGRP